MLTSGVDEPVGGHVAGQCDTTQQHDGIGRRRRPESSVVCVMASRFLSDAQVRRSPAGRRCNATPHRDAVSVGFFGSPASFSLGRYPRPPFWLHGFHPKSKLRPSRNRTNSPHLAASVANRAEDRSHGRCRFQFELRPIASQVIGVKVRVPFDKSGYNRSTRETRQNLANPEYRSEPLEEHPTQSGENRMKPQ